MSSENPGGGGRDSRGAGGPGNADRDSRSSGRAGRDARDAGGPGSDSLGAGGPGGGGRDSRGAGGPGGGGRDSRGPGGPGGGGDDATRAGNWRGAQLLWDLGGAAEPAPRRSTALDREQIVRAAVRIADAEGIDAVTMRRVAQQLNTGAMSLYRHVPDKDALVSMMIETVLGDAMREQPLPAGNWRESLRAMAQSTWRISQQHRWYPEANITHPPMTPNGVAGLEWALSVFDGYDLDIMTRMQFVGSVHHLALHAALDRAIEEQARERRGVSAEEAFQEAAPILEKLTSSGRYPHVAAFFATVAQREGGEEDWVLAGVDLILDGIEGRLARLGKTP